MSTIDNSTSSTNREKRGKRRLFLDKVNLKLYCYYGLFTWTDQMWMFTVGMALGSFGGDLQLAAAAAFVACAAILILGPAVGKWIDHCDRIKAALLSLVFTKSSAFVTTASLAAMLVFRSSLSGIMNGEILSALSVVCIFMNMVANLACAASEIIITKDWVVVVCQGDEDRLTATNAVLMRIKLISLIISPYIAGQIMEWSSIGMAAFIVSLLLLVILAMEYVLLTALHRSVPYLSTSRVINASSAAGAAAPAVVPLLNAQSDPVDSATNCSTTSNNNSNTTSYFSSVRALVTKFLNIWRLYWHQRVLLAGVSLALLYTTVLGFDSITDVYASSQGLKPNTVALVKGSGAAAGILGTFLYPRIWKRVGLVKTGLIALFLELSCLVMPLVSVWLPGSPFDPRGYFEQRTSTAEANGGTPMATDHYYNGPANCNGTTSAADDCAFGNQERDSGSQISISVYLIGLVLSRCGLWMADLTINQLFQQTVAETERASVNSVQNALNNFMDMLKNVLVIFMPSPKTFGLLIILSWSFVLMSSLCFVGFASGQRRRRHHRNGGKFEFVTSNNGCGGGVVVTNEVAANDQVET